MGLENIKRGSPGTFPPCVWMQSGVVRKKLCRIDYRCIECRYDRMMRKQAKENHQRRKAGEPVSGRRGQIVFWEEKLKERPPWRRPCIHHLKGRIDFRACTNDYRCSTCEFDQFFMDHHTRVHAALRPVEYFRLKGFRIPQGYYFYPSHTWVKVEENNSVKIGIDDFALSVLGPLDKIQPPLMGKEIRQGREDILIYREKQKACVLSPVSGIVISMNSKLMEEGSHGIEDPYTDGWLMTVHCPELRQEIKNLMLNMETKAFMDNEINKLYEIIEQVSGPLAVDGGILAPDLCKNLPGLDWKKLANLFLGKTG